MTDTDDSILPPTDDQSVPSDDRSDALAESNSASPEQEGAADTDDANVLGRFRDQHITELPKDLYIPPDALQVILETFEGPLDLLLYLIRRQNLEILDINVAQITAQYMQYVEMMTALQFELAAEYLVMAAMLAEIKSRMLLPRAPVEDEEEEDPRAQLIRRLQEYEQFKQAAEDLDSLPREGRNIHLASAKTPDVALSRPEPIVELKDVLLALSDVLKRADMFTHHQIKKETLSTRERMSKVLERLQEGGFVPFVQLFTVEEGRLGVVVTFLAVMELVKISLVELVQTEAFGAIHVKARSETVEEIELPEVVES